MKILAETFAIICLSASLSGCSGLHFRPNGVPHSDVWVDGTFIECSVETRTKADRCTVYKDDTGEILADGLFLLNTSHTAAERSELHFAAYGNGIIYLSDARKLMLWAPSERDPSRQIIKERLRALAAKDTSGALDCNEVNNRPGSVADCALRAFTDGDPFYAEFYSSPTDVEGEFTSEGFAGDADGNVYTVVYDSIAWTSRFFPQEAQLFDGDHIFVMPCHEPISLVKTERGTLTCSRPVH